jgi:hypothetical protein
MLDSPLGAMAAKKSKTVRKWVRPVRLDYDRHGLRSAFVPVQDTSTKDASMLIAAAIRQAWATDEDDDKG